MSDLREQVMTGLRRHNAGFDSLDDSTDALITLIRTATLDALQESVNNIEGYTNELDQFAELYGILERKDVNKAIDNLRGTDE